MIKYQLMKKPSVKSVKTRAWKAFSAFIRKRDKKCVTCGAPATQVGHYKHNSDKPNKQLGGNMLWYSEKNVHGQCTRCNCFNSGELDEYALYLEETYGSGILQELQKLYNTPYKWTIEELVGIAIHYEEINGSL